MQSAWPFGCVVLHSASSQWFGSCRNFDGTALCVPGDWILRYKQFSVAKFSSVQSLGSVRPFVTLWTAARQASLFITNSQSLLKLMSIKSVMPSNHLILCHPLLLLPSIFPTIRVFSNESVLCIRWPKYWSFSFSISPSNDYSVLISPKTDWLDLPAVQETLQSLLQHHSSKASILWQSAFFIVQLSYLYMTTRKTIDLTFGPLLAKWCLCFLICYLGLSWLFFQGARVF